MNRSTTIDQRKTGGDNAVAAQSTFGDVTLGAGRAVVVIAVLVAIWWAGVAIFQPAPFILPEQIWPLFV